MSVVQLDKMDLEGESGRREVLLQVVELRVLGKRSLNP